MTRRATPHASLEQVGLCHCMECKRMWNVPKGKDGPPDPAQKPPHDS